MAVSVFPRKRVLVIRQGVVELVINKTFRQFSVIRVATPLIGEEEVLRQRIGFIPRECNGLVRARFLFGPAKSLLRQVGQNSSSRASQNVQGVGIGSEFVRIDQAAASFIEGIARQAIVHIEFPRRADSFRKAFHQAMNLLLSLL